MSSTEAKLDPAAYASEVAVAAKDASRALAAATGEQKNRFLGRAAELIREKTAAIIVANQIDVQAAPG